MFARKVTVQLKPNMSAEFTQKVLSDVIPVLRKQGGFQDELTFTAKDAREAFGISLWDRKENAEAYHRGSYPQIEKILEKYIEGTPRIETFEVSSSTFHKVLAHATT
jgi:hypothetical protein